MRVHFYDFTKKENSTKRPTGEGVVYTCKLKSASGVLNPAIQLQIGSETLPDYNYCYIDEYRRYYYITEWVNSGALWFATLSCDIMATWKTAIGSHEMYILRSSEKYDGDIVDNFYPETCKYITHISEVNSDWSSNGEIDLTQGTYILGIVSKSIGQGAYNRGSIIYYAMNAANVAKLVDALLDDSLLTDFSVSDASLALQKAIVSPLDYIKTCYWLPIVYGQTTFGTELNTINVWTWEINQVKNIPLIQTQNYLTYPKRFNINPHPQAASRGRYLNIEPFTRMKLFYPPFGLVELDTTKLIDSKWVNCQCAVDFATGMGQLKILSENDNEMLQLINAQIGVQIQLSQVVKDYLNAGLSAAGGVIGAAWHAVTGDILGAIKSGFTGISSTVSAMKPQVSTIGSAGAVIDLRGKPALYQQFFYIVDEDNEHAGRPLCQKRTPASLGGFMIVREGDIAISGLRGEQSYIKDTLERGFYYE